ncbi:MAG TPA: glycosyltransferase family 2 protein [Bryobacteraceae bacterium]|nr:glycosyltransferase family 2 protein [Bryobacteraceae bacterium]
MSAATITAVIPVWNGREWLERLLDTLAAQTTPATEWIAVDNGSTDGAPEIARERGACVISMGRNSGFAAAVNRGIQASRGDWIAVLNTDVELASDYFEKLIAAAAQENAWFATGKILSTGTQDQIDGVFDALCRGGTAWRVGQARIDGPLFSVPRTIWSAPWTAAVFRAELFRRVGALEESFESYLEDVDFGLRCALSGCSGCYVPGAVAWHRGSAALGTWHPDTVRRLSRNQLLLIARHYPPQLLRRRVWHILVAQMLWACVALRHGAGWAWLRGKWQGIGRFRAIRSQRKYAEAAVLEGHLREQEHEICKFQQATRWDLYWRMYFLLTRSEAK